MEPSTDYQLFLGRVTYLVIVGTFISAVLLEDLINRIGSTQGRRFQRQPSKEEIRRCWFMVGFNLVWLGLASNISGRFLERLLLEYDAELPGGFEACAKIALFFVLDDLWFYAYHRTIHSIPPLYKAIHKQHHFFTAPFPAVSFAVHPAEMLLQSLGACLGPLILFAGQTHPVLFWAWLFVRLLQGIEDHLGYELKWSPTSLVPFLFGGSKFHDLHHQKFRGNYASAFGIIDRVFGTALEDSAGPMGKDHHHED
jgi:sterol desaturase/sphingolipid hydroxylase (fatty acid hydroxylase superfamily)